MKPEKTLSIIIVTFNSEKYITNCVNSVLKNQPKGFVYKVLVVDNNSSDNTIKTINTISTDYSENLKIIKNSENLGFARAVNQGIISAKTSDYFLLLNPDTILKNDSLQELLKNSNKCKSGIVGGITVDENNKQSGSYFRFPNLQVGLFDFTNFRKIFRNEFWHNYFYYLDTKFTEDVCNYVDVVTGGYMLITKDTIKRVGLFDERFFMYLEDVDFCYRAKKNNIKVSLCLSSKIFHKGGASSKNKDRIRHSAWLWSRKWFFIKHFNFLTNLIIQPVFLIDDMYILYKKIILK